MQENITTRVRDGNIIAGLLENQLIKLNAIDSQNWKTWKQATLGIIERPYTKDSTHYKNIDYTDGMYPKPEIYLDKYKNAAIEYITIIISELKTLGVPYQENKSNNTNIHNTVVSNQTQSMEINIVNEILIREIPISTMDEIKEIISSEDKSKDKKKKIVESLKETGETILAKTIAEILTKMSGLS